jgi:phosphatidylglycerophosphate synthase
MGDKEKFILPDRAIITSAEDPADPGKRICGLYPIERNIYVLSRAGISEIYLDLTRDEMDFFNKNIRHHIKNTGDTVISDKSAPARKGCIIIPANQFMQVHYLSKADEYFTEKSGACSPKKLADQFLLSDEASFKKGTDLAATYIVENTGGFIARKINKAFSIPISLALTKTRIHPNYLTVFNMIIGVMSGILVLNNTYWHIVIGGFLFQLASVLDGVDGEVAKFTFKVSKIGGVLDTVSDNTTLLLFLGAASYLNYVNMGGYASLVSIFMVFGGIVAVMAIFIKYLKNHSESASLVAYDKEFLQKLPETDPLIAFVHRAKYITKKEFFSIVFCLVCLTGRIDMLIPIIGIIIDLMALLMFIVDIKYRHILKKN